ncbi:GNAT family N-acetyltransferase [Luteolibacter sp. GHJ8]|uniref:GNAT family N-acetyltransferase n=1 Tax=Luteolibacter rhizosphaerae TaxID=2989719 RepID=A0ABT3G427_9BACT|nr:GNAT family N-acetyltransferase [Luteolibacter rhizosphaerae]MCW1914251.1 GNAT family N-acetyltransferase [Luteolibacter rhizosphaerae]
MTNPPWRAVADAYWARELGCREDELFSTAVWMKPHGEALADYNGVFALFRDGRAIVSFPADRLEELAGRLPSEGLSPDVLASHFSGQGYRVIGPAFIGYADSVRDAGGDVRAMDGLDRGMIDELRGACSEMEWEHGGSDLGDSPCSGSFEAGELAALAGYEVWDDSIAHICVVTHPDFRARGHAKRAASHLAARAIAAGLVPQYRTLVANVPSMKAAEALGFQPYARSVAVRLGERTQ